MIHLENKFGIQISTEFIDFIEQEVLPETPITADKFWAGLAKVVKELTPTNKQLLERRIYFINSLSSCGCVSLGSRIRRPCCYGQGKIIF